MLYKISSWLTGVFLKKNIISPNNFELLLYGWQITLATLGSLTSIFIVSLFFSPTYVFFFLIFFVPIRIFSGGYHASTYFRCFICTNSIFVICILLSKLLLVFPSYFAVLLGFSSALYIYNFAPKIHPNNPLSYQEWNTNRTLSKITILLQCTFIIISFGLNKMFVVSLCASCLSADAFLMIISPNRKEVNYDDVSYE